MFSGFEGPPKWGRLSSSVPLSGEKRLRSCNDSIRVERKPLKRKKKKKEETKKEADDKGGFCVKQSAGKKKRGKKIRKKPPRPVDLAEADAGEEEEEEEVAGSDEFFVWPTDRFRERNGPTTRTRSSASFKVALRLTGLEWTLLFWTVFNPSFTEFFFVCFYRVSGQFYVISSATPRCSWSGLVLPVFYVVFTEFAFQVCLYPNPLVSCTFWGISRFYRVLWGS